MNINSIFRETWRITWHCWTLWLLSGLMFLVMAPALILAAAFGGLAGLASAPGPYRLGADFLYRLPVWGWIVIAGAIWLALVVMTLLTSILQTATVRGAILAADQCAVTLRGALLIGRQRLGSLVKLGLTFGVLMMALALLPPLAAILMAVASRGQADTLGLLQISQTGLAPFSSVLGVAAFLLILVVAVEDLTPLRAARRSWSVLRHGWWGFLFVWGISAVPALVGGVLLMPLAVGVPLAFAFPNFWVVPALCGAVTVPVLLFILLFTAVFSTTMYTLVYRAAARLTQPGSGATPVPV